MSVLVNKNTRVVTQGITGATGQLHTRACRDYGTQMVAGVTPGKGGSDFEGIPIFDSVGEAVTLGGKELAVDGVVIVGEHGQYPTNLKGQWLLPRWWIYQQVIRVFDKGRLKVVD